jgi:hypothetical protein
LLPRRISSTSVRSSFRVLASPDFNRSKKLFLV